MEVKSISQKIFKSPLKNQEDSCNHTNPFGVNFKGNIISADVFETANESKLSFKGAKLVAKATEKGRLVKSTIVGSLGDVSAAISKRLDSVGKTINEFGTRMRDQITSSTVYRKVAGAWDYLNTTNAKAVFSLSKKLEAMEVPQLRIELERGLEAWGNG